MVPSLQASITRDAQVVTCSVSDHVYMMWFTEPEDGAAMHRPVEHSNLTAHKKSPAGAG
jgi:hypothetical protein